MSGEAAGEAVLHASCVAWEGAGLLITGPSGSGKSTLALEIISRGGVLVADDQVALTREGGGVRARAPSRLRGLIEARGLGILRAPPAPDGALLAAIADLGEAEPERLPPPRERELLGVPLPLVLCAKAPAAPAALIAFLRAGARREPT